jgi:hypothetical protein
MIRLKATSKKNLLAFSNFGYTANDEPSYFYDQMFSKPLALEAKTKYTITVEYHTTAKIHGYSGGVASASASCGGGVVSFLFSKSEEDNNSSKVNQGQIPRILISC